MNGLRIFPTALLLLSLQPSALPAQSAWARYRVASADEWAPLPVQRVTLTALPAPPGAWTMCLDIGPGRTIRIWAVSDRVPMRGDAADIGAVHRYVVREGSDKPIEYVDASSGEALLPVWRFHERLLPRPAPRTTQENGFAACGTLLGHVLSLEASGTEAGGDEGFPSAFDRCALDPGLLVCSGCWPSRETDAGRVSPPADYQYRALNENEYTEMIVAGANLFSVGDREEPWVRRRAFYRKWDAADITFPYPEILYRSTFVGCCMCIDEPAVRFGGDSRSTDAARRPKDMARLLETRVRTYYAGEGAGRGLARALRSRKVNLGAWEPFERDLIIWETEYASAWYQLAAGPPGIIHEGRYRVDDFEHDLARLFGPGLRLSPEEMFDLHYAFLRGAARAAGADWGISIYGQCDPALAPLALTMAYDRGARYLWYWTADHGHHVPYPEKIELMRHLSAHAKAHPRRPRAELNRAAETAVAWPDGYTLGFHTLWSNPYIPIRGVNAAGVEHREVVAAAMWEGVVLAKQGVPFDFVVDQGDLDRLGYRRLIRIGEDGRRRP